MGPSCLPFVRRGRVFLVPSNARQRAVKGPDAVPAGVGVVSAALRWPTSMVKRSPPGGILGSLVPSVCT